MNTPSNTFKLGTKEVIPFILFYMFFACLYYSALWINRSGYTNNEPLFNLQSFLNWGGVDYLLKLLLMLPLCWLFLFRLQKVSLSKRLIIHCFTLPVYVFCWQNMYYAITERLHWFHLTQTGEVWDTYITSLFYILQFGIIHAYVYFKENQESLKLEAALRETALKSELSALKAQLNPHFLYNVFNTINASIPAELEGTRQMIAELSDMFRYQLRASKTDLIPLRDELEFTRKYLDLEKARFDERLQVVIDADEDLLDEMIPPMLVQPLVENAIKHGIGPLINGGQITLTVRRKGSQLAFTIADTGIGLIDKQAAMGKGIGLTNTELRLNKIYGTSLGFFDNVPQGLVVSFTTG